MEPQLRRPDAANDAGSHRPRDRPHMTNAEKAAATVAAARTALRATVRERRLRFFLDASPKKGQEDDRG